MPLPTMRYLALPAAVVIWLPLALAMMGCGGAGGAPASSDGSVGSWSSVHPDSLVPWALPAGGGGVPVTLRLEELGIGPERFQPLRARYLQTTYDAPGEIGSRVPVTIHLDRAVQSGPWDGTYPAIVPGLREPGLIVDWQVQNSIYNAFDRVLTDRHLGMRQRVMPGGASVAGLVIGAVADGVHHRRVADPSAAPAEPGGTGEDVVRTVLPDGTMNVLTAPLVLSQMEVAEGDVFTLPGYALIGGPGGVGTPWLGLYEVTTVRDERGRGGPRVVEILAARRPGGWNGPSDVRDGSGRITRVVVTDQPPYLLAREDYRIDENGEAAPVREHLHLVDWAPLPLPGAALVPDSLWRIDLEAELFDLRPSRVPRVVAPFR